MLNSFELYQIIFTCNNVGHTYFRRSDILSQRTGRVLVCCLEGAGEVLCDCKGYPVISPGIGREATGNKKMYIRYRFLEWETNTRKLSHKILKNI